MSEFEDIVEVEGLEPEEEERLRRVHDLLVAAGPPPDLPARLERAHAPAAPVILHRRRTVGLVALLAAALAAFGGGYLLGHSHARKAAFAAERDVPMHGSPGRFAVIHIGAADPVGNWPMLVDVTGLPQQPARGSYYELWLTRNGKPIAPCGSFRVHGQTTSVRLSVPYSLRGFDGWVVTAQTSDRSVGPVVLTT